jgi:hypothetical protein
MDNRQDIMEALLLGGVRHKDVQHWYSVVLQKSRELHSGVADAHWQQWEQWRHDPTWVHCQFLLALIRLPEIFNKWRELSPEPHRLEALQKWVEVNYEKLFQMADAHWDGASVDPVLSTSTHFANEGAFWYLVRWDPYGQYNPAHRQPAASSLTTSSPSTEYAIDTTAVLDRRVPAAGSTATKTSCSV